MKQVEGGVDAWLGVVRCVQRVDAMAEELVRGPHAEEPMPPHQEAMLDAILGMLALREMLRPVLADVSATEVPDVIEGPPATWSREHLA